jgi:CDP-paratose synthetase
MKVLLTGATGFLGSHLLRKLLEENIQVVVLKRSFSDVSRIASLLNFSGVKSHDLDRTDLEAIFDEQSIDVILHCATNYGRRDNNPLEIIEANLMLPLRLLLLGIKHDVSHFINTDTLLDKRISSYSLSKKQFLDWLKANSSKIQCINVALEHFYGYQDDDTKFVTWIIHELRDGVSQIQLTPGEQKRDFIYVDDVVEAFSTILGNLQKVGPEFTEFQIGSGTTVSIRHLCQLLKKLTGNDRTHLNLGALPYREKEVMDSCADLSRIVALGWSPKTSLEDGLRKVVALEFGKKP